MKKFTKVLIITLCAVALVFGSVAGTVAYLTMKTDTVENTFTAGDINITLTQPTTLSTAKMVPGQTYTVDAEVTVKAGSESCWLFVKIEKAAQFDTYLDYSIVNGWTKLEEGVYYIEVAATTQDTDYPIINANTITAKSTLTKDDYKALNGESLELKFTAYAVQRVGFDTVAAAWTEAKTLG